MLRRIVSFQITATVALGRHHWCVDQSPSFTQPRSVYRNSVPVDQWCRHQNRTSNYIGGENNGTDVAQSDFEIEFICLGFFWQWGHSIPTLDGRGRGWVGRCCVVIWECGWPCPSPSVGVHVLHLERKNTHKFNLERKNLAGVHHQQSTTLTRLLNYLHLHVYFRRYPGTTDEL